MTPHMGKWYEKGGEINNIDQHPECVPADWHDPTPIPFLVAREASFLFSIAPRNATANGKKAETTINEVVEVLTKALEWLGAGAKTATGYGVMTKDERWQKEMLEEEQREEERLELQGKIAGLPEDTAWLVTRKSENGNWEDNGKLLADVELFFSQYDLVSPESIKCLIDEWERCWKGIMTHPDATQGRKKKQKYKDRPKNIAKKILALQGRLI